MTAIAWEQASYISSPARMNDPIVVLSEFGTHLDIMLFTAGNVTPFIFIVVVIKFWNYCAKFYFTSLSPVNTRTTIKSSLLERAATGVIRQNKSVRRTPIPNTILPPNLSAKIPPGICVTK